VAIPGVEKVDDSRSHTAGRLEVQLKTEFDQTHTLVGIKLLHTAVWLFFAGCLVAVPIAGGTRHFPLAAVLSGLVSVECLVLLLNSGRCPLTDLAGRHTADRRANFDIYLPLWLARRNKAIFGTLFAAGELFVLERWIRSWH
jgi:hypothetical protein